MALPWGCRSCFSLVGIAFVAERLADEEGHLPRQRLIRGAQASRAELAGLAVLFRALEFDGSVAIDRAVAAVAVKALASWADAGFLFRIELEILRIE